MNKDQLFAEDRHKQEEIIKSFVKKLSENPDADLPDIITKYIGYQRETVIAALIVSVDKGLITYDLKERLQKQIEANLDAHNKNIRQYFWEKDNAFVKYISGYQDDAIYNIIEDPHGIVIDVFHAILFTAKKRELISDEDYLRFYENAKSAGKTEVEIRNEDIDALFGLNNVNVPVDDAEVEAEKEKFWKCPKCNQLVGMELGVCWNCEAEVPEVIEHPDRAEIIKEMSERRSFNPVKTGLYLILAGVLVAVFDPWRHNWHQHMIFKDWQIGGYVFGGFFALSGVAFIVFGLFFKSKLDETP